MLEAFILGFWLIWSSDREIFPLSESLWFTIICIFLRALTAFDMPVIDMQWAWFNGLLWLFTALAFVIVNRSSSFVNTLALAAIAGVGYFQLVERLPALITAHLL